MKHFLFITLLAVLASALSASVTLVSYDGTQIPTAQGWTMTANNTIVTTVVQDEGRNVLKLVDPGYGEASNANNFVNITKSLDAPTVTELFTLGWEYRFTFKMGDENTEFWAPDSNTFATMTWYDPDELTRKYHTLQFGRNNKGETLVAVSGSISDVKILSAGYHDYALIYNANIDVTSLWIDGEWWKDLTPVNNPSGTASYVSFGDNSNQKEPRATARTTYFTDVSLVMTPEPTVSSLFLLAIASLTMRRSRAKSAS